MPAERFYNRNKKKENKPKIVKSHTLGRFYVKITSDSTDIFVFRMKITVNKGFISRKLGGKTVIFDGEKSLLFTLNETATLIYKKLVYGWDINQISDFLVKKYGLNKKQADKDIRNLVSDLQRKKIIKTA